MKVLIVEDDPVQCMARTHHIESLGYECSSYGDAESALEAYQKAFYHLVVQDIGLPGMNGIELCRSLRRLPQGAKSKILVVSGNTTPEEIRAVFEAGADEFLSKPVHKERFKFCVSKLMQQKCEPHNGEVLVG